MTTTCSIDGCERPKHCRGLCRMHYDRKRKGLDILAPATAFRGSLRAFAEKAASYEGTECLLWPYGQTGGYGAIEYPGILGNAARVVCTLAHGPVPEDRHVAHSCGNRLCVAPKHLRWATRRENEADKLLHGRQPRGRKQWMSKLTEDDIRAIRAERRRSAAELAVHYGVHHHHINFIQARKTWKWLED